MIHTSTKTALKKAVRDRCACSVAARGDWCRHCDHHATTMKHDPSCQSDTLAHTLESTSSCGLSTLPLPAPSPISSLARVSMHEIDKIVYIDTGTILLMPQGLIDNNYSLFGRPTKSSTLPRQVRTIHGLPPSLERREAGRGMRNEKTCVVCLLYVPSCTPRC